MHWSTAIEPAAWKSGARVEQPGERVLLDGVVEGARFGGRQQRLVLVRHLDDAPDVVGHATRITIGEQHRNAGVVEGIDQLGLGPSGVERNDDAPRRGTRAVQLDVLVGVARQDGDAIPGRRPQVTEHRGRPEHPVDELAEREAHVTTDEGLPARRGGQSPVQRGQERVHGCDATDGLPAPPGPFGAAGRPLLPLPA
jgi:hypothetical protein